MRFKILRNFHFSKTNRIILRQILAKVSKEGHFKRKGQNETEEERNKTIKGNVDGSVGNVGEDFDLTPDSDDPDETVQLKKNCK